MSKKGKRILYVVGAIGCAVVIAVVALFFYGRKKVKDFGPEARKRIIRALEKRFDADVELKSLTVSIYPKPKAVGEGLSIRHKGWKDPNPIISIRRFEAETDYETIIAKRNHVDLVKLEGLTIHIPPRGRSSLIKGKEENHDVESDQPGQDKTRFQFVIETMIADGTVLVIDPKVSGKTPLEFDIQKLRMHSVGPGHAMAFDAQLTNAKPPGLIDSKGEFGPWQKDDPRSTAVSGNYRFQNADLGVFKGISGILSSTGKYYGVLQHIAVDGTTDTPQFALKGGGAPVDLKTTFHSVVNGTDGDTILDPVTARFLHSEFVCRGGIVHQAGNQGKTVSLDTVAPHARMEDILHLILGRGKPVVTGAVNFKSKIGIPPGPQDVLSKLNLDGQFTLSSAHFTSPEVERRLRTLSDRARGISKSEEKNQPPETIASDLQGRFILDNGVTSFSMLKFSIPGAAISLTGSYNLRSEQINMQGRFRMQATLSDTQSGIKHWILKPFDTFFEKDGAGFEVPITVTGTRSHPEVGTEIFHKSFTIH